MTAEKSALTVSELTRRIKKILETGFPGILVGGELSNVKLHSSGHLYFTLKDESAQLPGVMWRSRVPSLSFVPADGMKVVVSGRITVYEVRGAYQIEASAIRPLGVGDLQIAFEKLKQQLAAEGLFELARKKKLPVFPERIGIVTSSTGAALHDMLNVLRRRSPWISIVFRPTRVQGQGAAEDIAAAIREFNEFGHVDLLIVGRGGGSLEDLWAFNEEIVARAIAASRLPVVSAVGHEIDFTIADFVADLRAPTPSAAAELAVPDRNALLDTLRGNWYNLHQLALNRVDLHRGNIRNFLNSYSFNRPLELFRRWSQRRDELERSLHVSSRHSVERASARYRELQNRILAMNPDLMLRRGYAVISREGRIIGSRALLAEGDTVEIRFHDGTTPSRIL
jgi:exodeoxyribonuclease VII large subunit